MKEYDKALVASQKEWVSLAEKYIQKDPEKGLFKITAQGPEWIEGVDPKEAEAAIDAFLDKETIIEATKLSINDIANVSLSPADIVALDPVLCP